MSRHEKSTKIKKKSEKLIVHDDARDDVINGVDDGERSKPFRRSPESWQQYHVSQKRSKSFEKSLFSAETFFCTEQTATNLKIRTKEKRKKEKDRGMCCKTFYDCHW